MYVIFRDAYPLVLLVGADTLANTWASYPNVDNPSEGWGLTVPLPLQAGVVSLLATLVATEGHPVQIQMIKPGW
jgi:hypothetical protein